MGDDVKNNAWHFPATFSSVRTRYSFFYFSFGNLLGGALFHSLFVPCTASVVVSPSHSRYVRPRDFISLIIVFDCFFFTFHLFLLFIVFFVCEVYLLIYLFLISSIGSPSVAHGFVFFSLFRFF